MFVLFILTMALQALEAFVLFSWAETCCGSDSKLENIAKSNGTAIIKVVNSKPNHILFRVCMYLVENLLQVGVKKWEPVPKNGQYTIIS